MKHDDCKNKIGPDINSFRDTLLRNDEVIKKLCGKKPRWGVGVAEILYPEEVRMDAIEAQLRRYLRETGIKTLIKREKVKGRILGHFC